MTSKDFCSILWVNQLLPLYGQKLLNFMRPHLKMLRIRDWPALQRIPSQPELLDMALSQKRGRHRGVGIGIQRADRKRLREFEASLSTKKVPDQLSDMVTPCLNSSPHS